MNEEQMRTLSLKAAYTFGATHGLEHEVNEIRDMVIEWDSSYTSSLRRGYIVALFEKHGIFEEFKTTYWLSETLQLERRNVVATYASRRNTKSFLPAVVQSQRAEGKDHPIQRRLSNSPLRHILEIFLREIWIESRWA